VSSPSVAATRTERAAPPDLAVAAVVLSWNARADVLACLATLKRCRRAGFAVVLVDNASGDGTREAVARCHPWVEVIDAGSNLGFAAGNNLGMQRALELGARSILLLNSDARIDRATVDALREHLERNPAVGAVQPLLVRMDDPATIDSAGQRLARGGGPREVGFGEPAAALGSEPRPIFGACAAAVLLRGEALREVGLFDADLFILFEDVDLMFRLRAAGWDVHLLPRARVPHRRGISSAAAPRTGAARRKRKFWLLRNRIALALRYAPERRLLGSAPRLLLYAAIVLVLRATLRGERVLALWWRFWRLRRASRSALRAHGVDRFFGAG
jgi:hypothetical protein